MTKVHGKRYAYKFDFQGLAAATQPASEHAYKYQSDLFMAPYHHGGKLSSFMSPHHGMATTSGKLSGTPYQSPSLSITGWTDSFHGGERSEPQEDERFLADGLYFIVIRKLPASGARPLLRDGE